MMSEIPTYPDEIDPNIRIAALESQLAEERAKREVLECMYADFTASYTGMLRDYRKRADKAERELAEERTSAAKEDIARLAMRDRAEKAEIRVISAERELERWRHGNTVEGDFICPNDFRAVNAEARAKELEAEKLHAIADYSRRLADEQALRREDQRRIAELQAFVDARRVRNCERRGRMPDDGTCGRCPPCLARDLAAKEKEPTR